MVKTIGRFLIILLVTGLVAGGLYWLVQANPEWLGRQDAEHGGIGDRLREQGFKDFPSDEDQLETRPHRGFNGGGEHNNLSGSLDEHTIASILRNLLIIGLTTLVVLGLQKLTVSLKRRRQAKILPQAES